MGGGDGVKVMVVMRLGRGEGRGLGLFGGCIGSVVLGFGGCSGGDLGSDRVRLVVEVVREVVSAWRLGRGRVGKVFGIAEGAVVVVFGSWRVA